MLDKNLKTIVIYVDDLEHQRSEDFLWVEDWLRRWEGQVRIIDYSTGGWEHIWKVEGPSNVIAEVPSDFVCWQPPDFPTRHD